MNLKSADVFISYAHADQDWVREILLDKLERRFSVIIDFRHFTAGAKNAALMTEAAKCSRHTLAVLTPAYVASGCCDTEANAAFMFDPAAKNRKLIPLWLEDCKIPDWMRQLGYVDFRIAADRNWEKLIRDLTPSPDEIATEVTGNASKALTTLSELMDRREIRFALSRFEAEFAEIQSKLDQLWHYKTLHDKFHDAAALYERIRADRHSDSRAADWDRLESDILVLEGKLRVILDVAADPVFPAALVIRVRKLQRISDGLSEAVAAFDDNLLGARLNELDASLATTPPMLDTRLVEIARSLPLDKIRDALKVVHTRITGQQLDQDQLPLVEALCADILSIEQAEDKLLALVDNHDLLQWMEADLRTDSLLDSRLTVPQMAIKWQDVQEYFRQLQMAVEWTFIAKLLQKGEALDNCLAEKGVDGSPIAQENARKAFKSFSREASIAFNLTDTTLHRFCTQLRPLGAKLGAIIGRMRNDSR